MNPKKNDGILEIADIVYADEARILFKENVNSKKALMYLQTGMNTIRQNRLVKVMRYGTINFIPTFSMYSVTTPIRNIHEFINYGFFQRQIIFFESESVKRRIENLNIDIQKVRFDMDAHDRAMFTERVNKIKRDLGKGFLDIKEHAEKSKITESDDVKEELIRSMEYMMRVAKSIYNPHAKEVAISFVSRVLENMYKLSVHSALMNRRSSITVEDVKYANDLLLKCFRTMINYLEEHMKIHYRDEVLDKNRKAALVKLLLQPGQESMRSGVLVDQLMMLWENSKPTVSKYLKRLVDTKFLIRESKSGAKTREVYYKLNPEIKDLGGYE